jgi:hypothetical protein
MAAYVKTLSYLIRQGMRRDKALLLVSRAHALTPDQVAKLAMSVR